MRVDISANAPFLCQTTAAHSNSITYSSDYLVPETDQSSGNAPAAINASQPPTNLVRRSGATSEHPTPPHAKEERQQGKQDENQKQCSDFGLGSGPQYALKVGPYDSQRGWGPNGRWRERW